MEWQWKCTAQPPQLLATPALNAASHTTYIPCGDMLIAISNADGATLWSANTQIGDAPLSSPIVDVDGVVYIIASNGVLAFDGSSGTSVWTYPSPGFVASSSPAIQQDGTLVVASYGGVILALHDFV